MKKYQELIINAFLNIAVALIAGGVLKLVLDKGYVLSAIITALAGAYGLLALGLIAKHLDTKES